MTDESTQDVSEPPELPDCTECGVDLEGNVDVEWVETSLWERRVVSRNSEAPMFFCSNCGDHADYPWPVLRELFASLWDGDPYDV